MSTTIRIRFETKKKLEALKRYRRESMDEIINRLIEQAVKGEWIEIFEIASKLKMGIKLNPLEEKWIEELAKAGGWNREDIVEDLKHIDCDPSERVDRYRELFEKYFREALKLKETGDTQQAAEKIWGAVTALIKLYAALKRVPVVYWSTGKIDRFITYNVEKQYRRLFRDIVDKGRRMHEHFYEANLDPQTFEERWSDLLEHLEKAKKIVLHLEITKSR